MKSNLRKTEQRKGKKRPAEKLPSTKKQNLRDSGPTPVARGGSGAKAPPLAARQKVRSKGKK